MVEPETTSSFRHSQRLSQSALELSLIDYDENVAGSKSSSPSSRSRRVETAGGVGSDGTAAALPSGVSSSFGQHYQHVLVDGSDHSSTPVVQSSAFSLSTRLTTSTKTSSSVKTKTTSSPTSGRKSSPIRAFLTPPLMRKRKPAAATITGTAKHQMQLNVDDDEFDHHHGGSTSRLCHANSRGKSFGFLSLLKAKFVDRSGRVKHPVVQTTSSVPALAQQLLQQQQQNDTTCFVQQEEAGDSSNNVVQHSLASLVGEHQSSGEPSSESTKTTTFPPSSAQQPTTAISTIHATISGEVRSSSSSSTAVRRESTSQQESNAPSSVVGPDNSTQPQSWASAGLSVAAATAASSVMPRLNLPKKVSIGSKRNTLLTTPHSSVEQTTSAADVSTGKHVTMASPMPAPAVTPIGPPPMSIHHQPPTGSIHGPFRLHIILKQGRDLAAKDSCGTSDPYVKFKLGNKVIYRSKTVYRDLNPVWEEDFDAQVDDLSVPLHIRVFDYDWGVQDDFLGSSTLDLSQLELNRTIFCSVDLFSDEADGRQGIIDLSVALYPKSTDADDNDHKTQPSAKLADQAKKLKVQIWSSVVNILVIEGKHLTDKDGEPLLKPYLRLRLATEKYKTKSVTRNSCSTSVTWLEQFDFHLYEDQSHLLEINLHEKSSLGREESIARTSLDLNGIEGERTHSLNCEFQHGGSGTLSLLVTISGTTASETISDLSTQQPVSQSKEELVIKQRYSLWRTLNNLRDVGHLSVKVFRATGLASADIGGKSDPFCVLQLVNARLQTQTEYKTLNPMWNKIFTFNVKDINSVLQVTVYDEDRDHRFEFLGAVAIPLLRIENGQKRWYALKERKLRSRAKGQNPQILLELNVVWNEIRATIQTLQPKEKKYIEPELKFNRHTFVRNVMRVKAVVMDVIEIGKYIESCWEWESNTRSCIGFAVFLVVTWNFEPYVIPLMLLLLFLRSFLIRSFTHAYVKEDDSDHASGDDDDEDVDEKNKEERKSLKERLQTIQEATLTVQNSIGYIASLFESIRNTFNFSVPFLSYLAIILLIASCVLLYAVPLRYLILGWGINKFTRKLLRPHSIPNNEALDFLSRVPDDEQLADFRELRLDLPAEPSDKSYRKVPKKK